MGPASTRRDTNRLPVFRKSKVVRNILIPPDATPKIRLAVEATLPEKERHRHFGGMSSSQALVQSVSGNLIALDKVDVLKDLKSDEGLPAFFDDIGDTILRLKHVMDHLGEPHSTSIYLWAEVARTLIRFFATFH